MSKELGNKGILFASKLDFTLLIDHLKCKVTGYYNNKIVSEGLEWAIRLFEDENTIFQFYFESNDGNQILYGTYWADFKRKIGTVRDIGIHLKFDTSFNIIELSMDITSKDYLIRKDYEYKDAELTGEYDHPNEINHYGNDQYYSISKKGSDGFKTIVKKSKIVK